MFDHVGERFLNDAVSGQVLARGQRMRAPGDRQVYADACVRGVFEQLAQVCQAGRRGQAAGSPIWLP